MELTHGRTDVVHLEVGDPDFPTPQHIVDAAFQAAYAGDTHYAPNAGLPELRELAANKLRSLNGVPAEVENVLITPGSGEALYVTALALLNPGDEVLLPDPCWPNFEQIAIAVGARPVRYPLDRRAGFIPDVEMLRALVSERTKAIVLNSPGNPTGGVYPEQVVRAIVELAEHRGLWLISDECYEQLIFEGTHVSAGHLGGLHRTVVIHSFSKTYAMTGWRVGYLACSEELAKRIARLQEPIVSCASTVSQRAAIAALSGPQEFVAEMRESYRRRRDLAVRILGPSGLLAAKPRGAFYALLDIGEDVDTTEFAKWLVEAARVAVAPGETFGPGGRGLVRISLAASDSDIEEGLGALVAAQSRKRRSSVTTRSASA
jgi:aspartate aminotransferase/aminotransferase